MFCDDPHIQVKVNGSSELIDGVSLTDTVEPIPNLLHKYNFSYVAPEPVLNYICGGRLGDFIHALYVVKCKYTQTGKKGNVYITDDLKWGGDGFAVSVKQTYTELYDIVIQQPYIENFSIYNGQPVKFDVNLNQFRSYSNLYHDSWLEIMSNKFGVPLIEKP